MTPEDRDIKFMKRALALAAKGRGRTFPNPMVGAVIVKNGKVLGEGFHSGPGMEHAETAALKDAGEAAAGAVLYVNLEPCAHFGRTPPCAGRIIEAKISRTVCAMLDPDPRVQGRGAAMLSRYGVKVETDVLRGQAEKLNEVYMVNRIKNRPFITIKSAMTLDGKIATADGLSRWITSEKSRDFVHSIRADSDGILTGIGTVEKDDPLLTARLKNKTAAPYRVVLDYGGRISAGARIFAGDPGKVLIASAKKTKSLEKTGGVTIECPGPDGRLDLGLLFKKLLEMGIATVLVEAGPEINASIVDSGMADRFYFFYAPKIFGGRRAPGSFGGRGAKAPDEAVAVKITGIRRFGEDILIEGTPVYPGTAQEVARCSQDL